MADESQYSDSIASINQEHSDNWQPIGVVVARLIGGAKFRDQFRALIDALEVLSACLESSFLVQFQLPPLLYRL